EAALRLDPNAARVYVNLGFALAAQGREDDAERAFRQALTPAEALNNLALARELRGDREAARRLYREALRADPSLNAALQNLETLEATP
ncbi:MAG: tetratricopeptide repeat protein, partial [Myxococcales bacterium]|nr:tetratricopeptide repeat protein [Myxococcales bacterium]